MGPLGSAADGFALPELNDSSIRQTALGKEKLRWVVGKFTEFQGIGNKYGERFTEHEMWRTLDTIVMDEIATHDILKEMRNGPASVKEIAARLSISPPDVLKFVLVLQRRGFVELSSIEGETPKYRAVDRAAATAAAA